MISRLFTGVLNMSLTAGLVILFVLIARLLLRRAPRIFHYCLWAVVLFRLLCPVSFSSPFSLLGTVGDVKVERGSLSYFADSADIPDTAWGQEERQEDSLEELMSITPAQAGAPGQIVQQEHRPDPHGKESGTIRVLAFLWISGMLGIAVYDAVTLRKLRRELKGAVQVEKNIYVSPIPTPFVLGVFRPRIYLPANLQGDEREYILLHEQIHIKRGDHLVKLLASVALCMHWFNPLVWVAFFLSSRDMEISCDEAVLRKMGNCVKKEYSASLLNLATGRRVISGIPLAFGEGNTGSRVKNVLRYKKPANIVVCVAVVICLILVICLVSNPAGDAGGGLQDTIMSNRKQQEELLEKESAANQEVEQVKEQEMLQTREGVENPFAYFHLNVRNVSVENRTIDDFGLPWGMEALSEEEPLLIAPDCVFEANYQMDTVLYEEISFETFLEIVESDHGIGCYVTMDEKGEQLQHIRVYSARGYQGIYPESYSSETANYTYQYLQEEYGENVLEEQLELVETVNADIADSEGVETIEIYTGTLEEYMKVGIMLYKTAGGEVLGTEGDFAHAYPTTYYVNKTSEGTYLLQIHLENRDSHGEYRYHVYRLGEDGSMQNIAGSSFNWSSGTIYDEEAFRQWLDNLNRYYKGSRFLMESRDDEIGTGEAAEEDRHTFESLSDFTKYDTVTMY